METASKLFGKEINSACEKAGQDLLRKAKEAKAEKKRSIQKDIYQGAKEIATHLSHKARARLSFVPSKQYQDNYGMIRWR